MDKPVLYRFAAGLFAAACMFAAADAAEIGRAEIGGRTVVIDDDGTWSYATEPARQSSSRSASAGCEDVESAVLPVSVCLDDSVWVLGNVEGNAEQSFRLKDEELYLMMITEEDYFPQKTLRDAILVNAQNAAGLKKVEIVQEAEVEFDGHAFDRIVYRTTVDGLDVTYDNYYSGIEGEGSVQFVFFSLTDDYARFKSSIEDAVQGVSVGD